MPVSEHNEQCYLFEYCRLQEGRFPELELLHAIPNGGHRHKAVAVKMQREGVKAGVPDVCLPVARSGFNGLYIELKVGKNKPTDNQIWWLDKLAEQGYLTLVCYSADEAFEEIEKYLEGRE